MTSSTPLPSFLPPLQVRGDVGALGGSYMAILAYMVIMLSRRDTVHSMMGIGIVTLLIVIFSFAGCQGLGGYLGLPNNQLNNNIPFLVSASCTWTCARADGISVLIHVPFRVLTDPYLFHIPVSCWAWAWTMPSC